MDSGILVELIFHKVINYNVSDGNHVANHMFRVVSKRKMSKKLEAAFLIERKKNWYCVSHRREGMFLIGRKKKTVAMFLTVSQHFFIKTAKKLMQKRNVFFKLKIDGLARVL